MSETIRTNFSYIPARNGYDEVNSWKTLAGAPQIQSGRLFLGYGTAIHYGKSFRGEFVYDLNIPAGPSAGADVIVGLYQPTSTAFVGFVLSSDFRARVRNSNGTTDVVLSWNSNWNGANVKFKIRWEAGFVRFVIDNTIVATIPGDNIPTCSLHLYLHDSTDPGMTVGDINVATLNYNYAAPGYNDPSNSIYEIDKITLTDSAFVYLDHFDATASDSASVGEASPSVWLDHFEPVAVEPSAVEDVIPVNGIIIT